jgi:hypothetical protein
MHSCEQSRKETRSTRWHAPKEAPNLSPHLRNNTSSDFADEYANFMFSSVWPVEVQTERSQSSTDVSPRLNHESFSAVRVPLTALSPKAIFEFKCVSDAVFPSLKQILRWMRHSFKSATGKIAYRNNTHKTKHPLRTNTEGYGCRTP